MSWFNQRTGSTLIASILIATSLGFSGCTIQPLNAVKPESSLTPVSRLSGIEIPEVSTRVGQQVRNQLIFGLNGGAQPTGETHTLTLRVTANKATIAVVTSTQAPTAAQVTVTANYTFTKKPGNEVLATGIRQAIASYDRTNQSFANQRAERDAENRAAKEVAEQLRLVISATLADQ